MLKDEAQIVKSLMIKLDDDHAMIVVRQYHTERNEYNKVIRANSSYRWLARIFKTKDLIDKIRWMKSDANRLTKFKWPDDPWAWYTAAKYPEHMHIADWLMVKYKKMKSWDEGQKYLAGWKNATKTNSTAGYNANAAYATEDYIAPDGSKVSLKDKTTLLKYVGKNLIKVDAKV